MEATTTAADVEVAAGQSKVKEESLLKCDPAELGPK